MATINTGVFEISGIYIRAKNEEVLLTKQINYLQISSMIIYF